MTLADFIESHLEPILSEWVTFAESSGPAGRKMDVAALRDHAREMLVCIVEDLRTPQSKVEQSAKSKGDGEGSDALAARGGESGDGETAAEVHGAGRATGGFTVGEMVSEYRALRASVIRLWTESNGTLAGRDVEDLMRFNEAIDQSLAESITRYTLDIDRAKEMFVAILGHDLRSPLSGVLMASQFMLEKGLLNEEDSALATRIFRGGTRMNEMIRDLLDFTRGRLGSGVPITPHAMDLGVETSNAVTEMQATHPDRAFTVETSGDLRGEWDPARIGQLLINLLGNAVSHGSSSAPILVTVRDRGEDVLLRVHNRGPVIPATAIPGLFSPFKRLGGASNATQAGSHLGLGLFIVEQIATAHGGTIDVTSSEEDGTAFTVRLPRSIEEAKGG